MILSTFPPSYLCPHFASQMGRYIKSTYINLKLEHFVRTKRILSNQDHKIEGFYNSRLLIKISDPQDYSNYSIKHIFLSCVEILQDSFTADTVYKNPYYIFNLLFIEHFFISSPTLPRALLIYSPSVFSSLGRTQSTEACAATQ